MPKPKPKSIPPRNLLTIQVMDNEDFSQFCLNLLDHGYLAWLAADGRLPMAGPPPLHTSQPWPEWRKIFTQIARQWWEEYTEFNEPKRHPRNQQDHCWGLIHAVIGDLAQGTAWTWDDPAPPPYHGRPLSANRLATLMSEKDPDPNRSIQMYRNYATLWLIHRKLATSAPLRQQDLTFLKKHDQTMYRFACHLSQQSSPRN